MIPGHIALNKVDVWFQDEARFGQQNTTTRLWAQTGSRPRCVQQQQFEYAYLFGAAWHQLYLAGEFANLSIIKLPPYSPELNSIEQVWQWLRQNELANRCFEGYDDIVEQCCRAWNNFISESKRVVSLCTRDWIKLGD